MASFKCHILEFLHNVNKKYPSLRTMPEIFHKQTNGMNYSKGPEGRRERSRSVLGLLGEIL